MRYSRRRLPPGEPAGGDAMNAGRRRGFTLIEVLATMVLLGIIIPVAMRGVSISLAAADKAKHTSQAAALAESKLNDLLTQSASGGSGGGSNLSGDFAP